MTDPSVASSPSAPAGPGADTARTCGGPEGTVPAELVHAFETIRSSPQPLALCWGPDLTLFHNDAMIPVLGDRHPGCCGRPVEALGAEVWARFGPVLRGVLDTGTPHRATDDPLLVERDGSLVETFWDHACSPIRDEHDRVLGVLVVVRETTSRVVAERRLRLLGRLAVLGGATESVRDVLRGAASVLDDAGPDIGYALFHDLDGPQAELVAIAGLDEAPTGLPVPAPGTGLTSVAPPADAPRGRTGRAPIRLVCAAPGPDVGVGMVFALGDGAADGDEGRAAFLRDVVERVGAAAATARARTRDRARIEALTAQDRARGEFLAGVSHEFRTPLALVLGPLELLRESAGAGARADIEVVRRNAQRLLRLVDSLLDMARLDVGHDDSMFVPVDLGPTTAELAELFRPAAERAGLSLDVDCPPTARPVWVDRDMWERIVLNLLSNAVKFTVEGGVGVSVRVDAGHAELRVTDTGAGIPDQELPRLFERFHRVRSARTHAQEGTGIGLSLVHGLVDVHGGTIEVESATDVGTTFVVRLPTGVAHLPVAGIAAAGTTPVRAAAVSVEHYLAELVPERSGEPDAGDRPAGPVLPAGQAADEVADVPGTAVRRDRVLVVDDDADTRDYLRRLLAQHWTVEAVADARQALETALSDPPDLVVADVMMSGTDGIALLRALRTDARTAGLPVVLLSARAGEEAAVEGLAAGADDYLVKPFSARELLARVSNHLQLGRTRRAAELRFRATADATPALIWVDDAGGHRVFVNRGWLDFTGVSDPVTELAGWRERIHPEDRARHRSVTTAAIRNSAPFEVEYRLSHRDGRYRWVLDRGVPIGGDRPAGYVGGCLDIDARHTEQHRHRLYADLGDALDAELTATGRLRVLARLLVDEGLADMVRVHEGNTDDRLVLRAVAAQDPATEDLLRAVDSRSPARRDVMAAGTARIVAPGELAVDQTGHASADRAAVWNRLGVRSTVVVPLTARGGMLGLLGIGRTADSPPYSDDDLEVFAEIGRRAGVALDNARLLELERDSAQRLGLLHRATAEMSAAATPTEVARIASRHLVSLLDAPVVGVWELRDDTLEVLTGQGWSLSAQRTWSSIPLSASPTARDVVESRAPLWFDQPDGWRNRWPSLDVAGPGTQAMGLLPLAVGQRCLGVLGVAFREPRDFSESDREAAAAVAELAAQALDRSSLLVAETEGRRVAERLGAVATSLSRATDLGSVAAVIVAHGVSAVEADAVVVLLAGDGGVLHPLAEQGWAQAATELSVTASHPLARAVRTGEPAWQLDPGAADGPYPVHSAVPMLVGGRPIGVIGFRFDHPPQFSPERRSFVVTLASQCAQAVSRARLHQAEHEVAVTLQRSLLPQRLPEIERLSLATRYQPGTEGTEAGGDWFDVLDLDDDRVALVVGDVVGRGPAAAAVMGQLRSALAANLVNGQSPAGALEQLDLFALRVGGAMASTVVCAVIDCSSGELRYACAGHPPPLLAGPAGVRLLEEGRGTPLGVTGRPPFVEAVDRIEPGETILLCSDGLFERRTEVIDDGMDRLAAVFGALADGVPESNADALLERMSEGSSVPDDTALVMARLLPAPLHLRLPADPHELAPLRRAVAGWCARSGLGADAVTDLQLVLGEAVTNAVEHAYAPGAQGSVEVTLTLLPDTAVAVRVADTGHWRPPPADPGYRGRGLLLIREIAEDVVVEPAEEGTVVRCRMPALPDPGPASVVRPAAVPAASGVGVGTSGDGALRPTRLVRGTGTDPGLLHVDGDLDLAGVANVRTELLDEPPPWTLSLAVDCYISSAGVALLTELAQRARGSGTEVTVMLPSGSAAWRILQLAGLDEVVSVVALEESGAGAIGGRAGVASHPA